MTASPSDDGSNGPVGAARGDDAVDMHQNATFAPLSWHRRYAERPLREDY
jgi:hypothetical protein